MSINMDNIDIQRILVIDDDEDNTTLIKFALEMNTDWEILLASDGREGVTKAELERPDLILLDVIMPGLDGLNVCEILKANLFTCSIPVIFITAMTSIETLSQLKTSLAEAIIIKPFNPVNLDSQIAEICNKELRLKIL
jgi:CheY-like chemotaxis protein